jgi:hypothetical protein
MIFSENRLPLFRITLWRIGRKFSAQHMLRISSGSIAERELNVAVPEDLWQAEHTAGKTRRDCSAAVIDLVRWTTIRSS